MKEVLTLVSLIWLFRGELLKEEQHIQGLSLYYLDQSCSELSVWLQIFYSEGSRFLPALYYLPQSSTFLLLYIEILEAIRKKKLGRIFWLSICVVGHVGPIYVHLKTGSDVVAAHIRGLKIQSLQPPTLYILISPHSTPAPHFYRVLGFFSFLTRM